jgi:DNA transformation protein
MIVKEKTGTDKAELLIEKLNTLGDITYKKMFGEYGIFHEGKMFCLVDAAGQGYLKMDKENANLLIEIGGIKHKKMPYFSIPQEIFNDHKKLIQFANKSIKIANKN